MKRHQWSTTRLGAGIALLAVASMAMPAHAAPPQRAANFRRAAAMPSRAVSRETVPRVNRTQGVSNRAQSQRFRPRSLSRVGSTGLGRTLPTQALPSRASGGPFDRTRLSTVRQGRVTRTNPAAVPNWPFPRRASTSAAPRGGLSGATAPASAGTFVDRRLSFWTAQATKTSPALRPGQMAGDLPVAGPIDAAGYLGARGATVPQLPGDKGLQGSPLDGVSTTANLGNLLDRHRGTGGDRSNDLGQDTPPHLGSETAPFDPISAIPGMAAGQARGNALRESLEASGRSNPRLNASLGGSESPEGSIGHDPNRSGGIASDLAATPGLPGGQSLQDFDNRNDPRLSNGSGNTIVLDPVKITPPSDTYNKNGVRVYRDAEGHRRVSFSDGAGAISPVRQWGSGGKSVVVRDSTGNPLHIVTPKDSDEDPIVVGDDETSRPVDDGFQPAAPTADAVRRFEAKRGGLVDPAGPDQQVEHDAAKLSTTITVWQGSTVNPVPEGGLGFGGEAGTHAPQSKLPGGVGPGVVDPANPSDGEPLPGAIRGPKPSVGPGKGGD